MKWCPLESPRIALRAASRRLDDVNFHPVEPRELRVTLTVRF